MNMLDSPLQFINGSTYHPSEICLVEIAVFGFQFEHRLPSNFINSFKMN